MKLHHDPAGPLVLVGGSGVVGRALAPMLSTLERRPLVVASRTLDRAAPVIEAVRAVGGDAAWVPFELGGELSVSAAGVVGLVNDPADALLRQVVAASVPFVDITRWTSRLALSMGRLLLAAPKAPVVLASGWMGGLLSRVARSLAATSTVAVERVDGAIRYALADASGLDSVDYMDRLWIPFDVPEGSGSRVIEPFHDRRVVTIDGHRTAVYRFDTPEQWTLPIASGIPAAAVRLGFDSAAAGWALWMLVRLGVFRLLRGERFRRLRQTLLRPSGAEQRKGARSAFRVDVRFVDGTIRARTLVADGQAHLTAAGAWLALRQALSAAPGVYLPEQDRDHAALFGVHLPAAGITVLDEA